MSRSTASGRFQRMEGPPSEKIQCAIIRMARAKIGGTLDTSESGTVRGDGVHTYLRWRWEWEGNGEWEGGRVGERESGESGRVSESVRGVAE